jgi:hypothetical protein
MRCYNRLIGEAKIVGHGKRLFFDSWEPHLTSKISTILRAWDSIAIDERQFIMRELDVEDGDEDRALALLEKYLLLDHTDPVYTNYNSWVLNGSS